MRALVYHGPGQKAWQEAPEPEITLHLGTKGPAARDVGPLRAAGLPDDHELWSD